MIRHATLAFALGSCLLSLGLAAQSVRVELPADQTPAELAGAEAEVIVNNCSSCHSLDYITTQPRGKGEQFWRDAVTKMVTVYKAPLSAEDADAATAVLARKFG